MYIYYFLYLYTYIFSYYIYFMYFVYFVYIVGHTSTGYECFRAGLRSLAGRSSPDPANCSLRNASGRSNCGFRGHTMLPDAATAASGATQCSQTLQLLLLGARNK